MNVIIFTRADDGGLSVMVPTEGARLAYSITLADGTTLAAGDGAQPVDSFLRGWPVEGAKANWAETEDEFTARILKKDVPTDAWDVRIIDAAALPSDLTFFNAWRHDGNGGVDHDMDKAREIHKTRLRELRAPRFATWERKQRTALTVGDIATAKAAEAQLQALRDVTADPAIAAAVSPDELKKAIPEVLR